MTAADNLVPRAFPLKNGWTIFFKGKALGTRLCSRLHEVSQLHFAFTSATGVVG